MCRPSAVAFNGCFYVIGGREKDNPLCSVERFDPLKGAALTALPDPLMPSRTLPIYRFACWYVLRFCAMVHDNRRVGEGASDAIRAG